MKAIPYYRVSTKKQGQSGLGLEGQQEAVRQWAKSNGAEIVPVPPYVEVESGKRSGRPKLAAALAHAKAIRGTLVVAKLDRLSRNVAFLATLMEAGVDFVAVDNPNANRLTIHILVAVAEDEAKRISDRTKAALTAYKARGGKLGGELPQCRNLTTEGRQIGAKAGGVAKAAKAAEAAKFFRPLVTGMREQGLSLRAIAEELNQQGFPTLHGKKWSAVQVMRLTKKTDAAS